MIIIVTKVLCYHQVYIADEMHKIYGNSFKFIQMREPLDWRVKNKQEGFERSYLVSFQKNPSAALDLVKKANVIIFGEAPLKLIRHRNKKCLLFKMSENIYKDTLSKITLFGKIKRWLSYEILKLLTSNKHSFLLSCGAFAYRDYAKIRIFRERAFKWGYFPYIPKFNETEIADKFKNIETIEMVWISRLIGLKNPLYLIQLVEYLVRNRITNFHLTIVGNSDESDVDYFSIMTKMIKEKNLSKYISMAGRADADKVFDFYAKSHIALFTSDKSEGWSVGIGEAMSCGCAVISSNTIGAAPYLISNNNGLIFKYDSTEDLCKKVEYLLANNQKIKDLSLSGLMTIKSLWNYKVAAERLSYVIDQYVKKGKIVYCENGPCSRALLLDYDWYLEKK